MDLTWEEAEELANDKVEWRRRVESLLTLKTRTKAREQGIQKGFFALPEYYINS